MTRGDLLRAVDLAHAAAHNTTLAMAFDGHSKASAERYAREAEDALYAALDALAVAKMTPGFLKEQAA